MYVSSGAVIPGISTGPLDPRIAARFDARRRRVFAAVASAASRYDCAPSVSSFNDFGLNLKYQVQRAQSLINQVGQTLSSVFPAGPAGVPSIADVQQSITPAGTSGAPNVTSLAPVNTNPLPAPPTPSTNWTAPHWANAAAPGGVIPTPQTAAARNPWLSVVVLATLALAAGAFNGRSGGGRL